MIKFVLGGAMDPSFKGTLDKSVSEAERAATRINAALSRRTAELERRAKDLPGGSVPRLQIENQIANNREKLAQNAHRADYKRHLERKKMALEEAAESWRAKLDAQRGGPFSAADFKVSGKSGAMRHMGAIGGASSAMMISVMRDTMASLASGANPLTVFMQQAPQVAQAMTMMNKGMFDFVKTALKIPIGPWGVFAGIVAGLAVGLLAAYAHTKALIDKLSGIKIPDFQPEYIAKHLKQTNLLAEAWKEVDRNVRNTIAEYNGVAAVAERLAAASKTEFDHRRKILSLEKEKALASAHSPLQKVEIEKKFRAKENTLDKEERDQALAASQREALDLTDEGRRLMGQSGALLKTVPGKTKEEQDVALNKQRLEAAEAAAKAVEEAKNAHGFLGVNGRDAFRAYNAVSASPVTSADLDKAEAQITKDRNTWRQVYKDSVDKMHANDQTRQTAGDLKSRADKSLTRAADLTLKNQDQARTNTTADKNAASEATAQYEADRKRALQSAQGRGGGQMIEWERAGGFMGGPQVAILDVSKKQLAELIKHTRLIQNASGKRSPWGGQ